MSVTRNKEMTLSATMIFSPYPQAYKKSGACVNFGNIASYRKPILGDIDNS